MISFKSISFFKHGQLFDILVQSYKDLIDKYDTKNKGKYIESWIQADKNSFDNPNTIGKCVLVTLLDGEPIGFISWDPRNFPDYGIIGQNCLLPKHRGKGYGKRQIEKLLKIFKEAGCNKAIVTTGDNDFFIPAQKMYESLGFRKISRKFNEKWSFNEIEYEKLLN